MTQIRKNEGMKDEYLGLHLIEFNPNIIQVLKRCSRKSVIFWKYRRLIKNICLPWELCE